MLLYKIFKTFKKYSKLLDNRHVKHPFLILRNQTQNKIFYSNGYRIPLNKRYKPLQINN